LCEFWENILARRVQFRQIPDSRLPLSDYYAPDPSVADKTYGSKAALIDDFKFDWINRKIPKTTYESTDIVHWLALETAIKALEDSGLSRKNVPTEFSGFVSRALQAAAKSKNLSPEKFAEINQEMEQYYKSVFAPITEDSLAGGLSNTIAGRICNFLDFHGGGYTIDGACSSSLLAIANASSLLINGDLEIALVGGVDISLDTFELIGFSKTGALTKDEMTVYDRRANGFIPGEGCGFVVLKKLENAKKANDKIYAVINGWGISSDGKGGITAPNGKSQAKAILRAYNRAKYSSREVDFIEGHGTGTTVGDIAELEGISISRGSKASLRSCGVTSLKSIIGHTKAASGIGGFIKTVIALNQRILPPLASCKYPNQVFEEEARSLYPILTGEIKSSETKLKAGVTGAGFGGINCHVTLESADPPFSKLKTSIDERALLSSNQETELFIFAENNLKNLIKKITKVKTFVAKISQAELTDLSEKIISELSEQNRFRASIIASSPQNLFELINELELILKEQPPVEGETFSNINQNIWIGNKAKKDKVGFLFPGQGSQFLNMGKTIADKFSYAQDIIKNSSKWLQDVGSEKVSDFIFKPTDKAIDAEEIEVWEKALKRTVVAQPAICLTSLLHLTRLESLGINPVAAGGHSLGELSAFFAAGAFDKKSLIQLASIRGKSMSVSSSKAGAMASLACSLSKAEQITKNVDGYVIVSNINSPNQIVISGEKESIEKAINIASFKNIRAKKLQVSNAFHSQLVSSASNHLLTHSPIPKFPKKINLKLFSSIDGKRIKQDINLHEHFAKQILSQVNFVAMIKSISKECDLMLEVGPGKVLSNLTNTILGEKGIKCFPLESTADKDHDLNTFLANYFVSGGKANWQNLNLNRLIRPFKKPSEKVFIKSILEQKFVTADGKKIEVQFDELTNSKQKNYIFEKATDKKELKRNKFKNKKEILEFFKSLISEVTGFPKDSIHESMRLLDDLNLDSIKSTELISKAANQIGVSIQSGFSKISGGTLGEIADVFYNSIDAKKETIKERWVKSFVLKNIEKEVPQNIETFKNVLAISDEKTSPFKNVSFDNLNSIKNYSDFDCCLIIFPIEAYDIEIEKNIKRLHKIAQFISKLDKEISLICVQFKDNKLEEVSMNCTTSFFATFHLEHPEIKTKVINFNLEILKKNSFYNYIKSELFCNDNYQVVNYDKNFSRSVQSSKLLDNNNLTNRNIKWSSDDVILVTGGAKGITAECGLAFAKKTKSKMALVGSSPLTNLEVIKTLEKYEKIGRPAQYFQCNITEFNELNSMIKFINKNFGKVAAVVHGAGLNIPRKVESASVKEILSEISPKIYGAINLHKALKSQPLKLFAALTSIIGITGMPGNAWYGLSNEMLDSFLGKIDCQRPETDVVSMAFSVWDEVGMGQKLGTKNYLENIGIHSIPKEKGVKKFMELIEKVPEQRQVIIAAKMSGLETWKTENFNFSKEMRFLEDIKFYYPEVEAVSRVHLNIEKDEYLKDHIWKGAFLFPSVFGLEAMAQVVSLVTGKKELSNLKIQNISLEKPIVVNPETGLEIEITAVVLETENFNKEKRIKVGITTSQTEFSTNHFSAVFVLDSEIKIKNELFKSSKKALDILPERDLYGALLFQGKRFQQLKNIYELNSKKVVFSRNNTEYDKKNRKNKFLLGNPFLRDVLLQSLQLTIPKDICLPIKIDEIQINKFFTTDPICCTILEEKSGETYKGKVTVIDEKGNVIEKISGYLIKILEKHEENPTAEELANPAERDATLLRNKLNQIAENVGFNPPKLSIVHEPEIHKLSKAQRHKIELPILKQATSNLSKTTDFSFEWMPSGKPRITNSNNLDVSVSHEGGTVLCLAGKYPQGCDLLEITNRNYEEWISLLGNSKKNILNELLSKNEAEKKAGARIWAAVEAIKKVTNEKDPDLKIDLYKNEVVVFKSNSLEKKYKVLTFPIKLTRNPKKIVAIIFEKYEDINKLENLKSKIKNLSDFYNVELSYDLDGRLISKVRFPVTFKEASNLSRTLNFSNYFAWIGKLRELMIQPVMEKVVEKFASGKWGMVTNYAETEIFQEAKAGDVIEGKFWLDKVSGNNNSTLNLCFEWLKILPNGQNQKVASSSMSTTWVEIIGHGVVRVRPFSSFMQEYVQKLIPEKCGHKLSLPPKNKINLGRELFHIEPGPTSLAPILREETFETSMEDGNLVGNIYFANYYKWQGRVRDNFLHNLLNETSKLEKINGEFRAIDCKINHVAEAMPFDKILIVMRKKAVYEKGAVFVFDYYRLNENGSQEKLAFGVHKAAWLEPNMENKWFLTSLPREIYKFLRK